MSLILLRGGRVLKGKHWVRANLVINPHTGRIVNMYRSSKINLYLKSQIDQIIDAKENLILPGLIDLHFHFNGLDETTRIFETESAAAVAGGVSTVIDVLDEKPYTNFLDKLSQRDEILGERSFTDYGLAIGLPDNLDEFKKVSTNEPVFIGVKIKYYRENEEKIVHSSKLPKNLLYIFHAESRHHIDDDANCLNYDEFEKKRPEKAEIEAVKDIVKFSEKGYKVHITHVSSWKAIDLILRAKKMNNNITFDTTPYYLILSRDEIKGREELAICYPPLRDKLNKIVLTRMFRYGLIEAISSSHTPKNTDIKRTNLCEIPPGISAVQYTLPLIFTLSKKIHVKDPRILLKVLSENPAKIIGLKDKGRVKVGNYADLIIFDHRKKWRIDPELNYSKAKETPYDGMVVRGVVKATFIRGNLVYFEGELLQKVGKNIINLNKTIKLNY